MPLTEKQRKYAWIGAAALAVIYLGPSVIQSARQAVIANHGVVLNNRPAPVRVAPQPPITVTPAPPIDRSAMRLLGNWQGGTDLPDRGHCTMSMQIKRDPNRSGVFDGYQTIACMPSLALLGTRQSTQARALDAINARTPTSVIMSGPIANGAIDFNIDRLIGVPVNGCKITALSVTPFSDGAVAVEWKNVPCPDGEMILRRPGNSPF